jgi:hypothetical protein
VNLSDYNRRTVDDRLGRLETRVATIEMDVAIIKASIATKDDIIQLQRWMVTLLLPLILPIYGVLLVILIFLYNLKP